MASNHPPADFEESDNLGRKAADPDLPISADDDRDPFEELASEFVERFRKGESPSIEEYAASHPDLAEEIRELFPTMAAMESAKAQKSSRPKQVVETLPMEQLGDFRLLGEIGRGGMGIVYEAEQVSLGRHVAVKVLPKQALLDERHLRRFEREAQTAAKLHHTNIVPVFGVGQQDGYNYIVMQFIAGVGLDEVLLALRRQVIDSTSSFPNDTSSRASHANVNATALLKGDFGDTPIANLRSSFVREQSSGIDQTVVAPRQTTAGSKVGANTVEFSTDEVVSSGESNASDPVDEALCLAKLSPEFYQSVARIGQQISDALAYAHEQGTLHRDIKPGNLLLDGTGTVWVADFGLAKLAEQDNVSRTGDIVGTLSYIPPESFSGETDARGDIYSLGLSLFELLTLRPAYYGRDRGKLVREITEGNLPRLGKLNPSIPRDLETIVLKAVAHRPEDRYATAREMAEDLDCYMNDMPIKARRMSIPEQFSRWYRKNKLVAGLSAAVLSLLVLLTVTFGVSSYLDREKSHKLREQATLAKEQKDIAVQQTAKANEASQQATQNAEEALRVILSTIRRIDPNRLPVTANASENASLAQSNVFVGPLEADAEFGSEDAAEDSSASAVVAAIPPTAEKAALLEVLVKSLEDFAQKAGKDSSLAATFAELALSKGALHKTLGNLDEAKVSFDDAISRYESLVTESNEISHVIGLAVCLNEKGDLIRQADRGESRKLFRRAQELLKQDSLASSTRAQYELARTFFLMTVRKSRSGRRRFEERGIDEKNLIAATEVLEPLLKKESNPEYRYLLARCYTGLSQVTRPDEWESYTNLAMAELSKLVADQPDVADYKFEYAIAKLRRSDHTVDVAEQLAATEEAVNLLEDVCSSNPGVSNYQVVRSKALGRYTGRLDRRATELEAENKNDPVAIWRGRQATESALRTADAFDELQARFPAETLAELDRSHAVEFAEVIAKADEELAIPLFRQIIEREKDALVVARARLGLGRSLKRNVFQIAEARQVLQELQSDLETKVEKELKRARAGSRRFSDSFQLLCLTEFELHGLSAMEERIDEIRSLRTTNGHDVESETSVARVDFDLRVAEIYAQIGEYEKVNAIHERSEKFLDEFATATADRREKGFAFLLLSRIYRERGDAKALKSLFEKMPKLSPSNGPRKRP